MSDEIFEERTKKFGEFLKNSEIIYLIGLIVILVAAFYIRTNNVPQLRDVTTGNYTLGPDLDPFLALRWAKDIVVNGHLMENDTMRNVPLGYDTKGELTFWPLGIVWTYQAFKIFNPNVTIEYAAIYDPVIFFVLTLLFTFLFVRKLFDHEGIAKSNIIALLSTLIFSFMPALVHRTVAGIPEKEAPGLCFMMLSFYLFTCLIKNKDEKGWWKSLILGISAGIATGMAGMFWGGYGFILLAIALTMLASFFFGKISTNDFIGYSAWTATFTFILAFMTTHYGGFGNLLFSTTSGACYFVWILLFADKFLIKDRLKDKIKVPRSFISFAVVVLALLVAILIIKPIEIVNIISDISSQVINPFATNRFMLTVAENQKPFFGEWINTFSETFFWMFMVASVILVYELVKTFKMEDKWGALIGYIIAICCLVFSKFAQGSTFNGTNTISQVVYAGGLFLFVITLGFILFDKWKRNEEMDLDKGLILLLAIFFFGAISARSAVRLMMLLAIPTPILVSFGAVKLIEYAKNAKDEFSKWIIWVVAGVFIASLIVSVHSPYLGVIPSFEQRTYYESKYTSPSAYTLQWQEAMAWVRNETSKDAVFAHWWDYGYWVQSLGERATILDGGNAIVYWNHLLGRHVLMGQNETEALEFLKTHDADYLLIDSTDIGKYPAYASIGSDENYDRYSWISTFTLNPKLGRETRNESLQIYTGGTANDADIIWGNQIILAQTAGIIAMTLPLKNDGSFSQPIAALSYHGNQINIPMNCLYIEAVHKKYTFTGGIDSCMYVLPNVASNSISNLGSAFYLSEKAMNALWVKLYLFDETENFELVHSEQDLLVENIRNYNITIPDIVIYSDVKGPIKIWKINYPENITINPEYLKTVFPNENLEKPMGA